MIAGRHGLLYKHSCSRSYKRAHVRDVCDVRIRPSQRGRDAEERHGGDTDQVSEHQGCHTLRQARVT